jgi:hypothetical protein
MAGIISGLEVFHPDFSNSRGRGRVLKEFGVVLFDGAVL